MLLLLLGVRLDLFEFVEEASALLSLFTLITIYTHFLCVGGLVLVDAVCGKTLASNRVVADLAHALRVVLFIRMGTLCNLELSSPLSLWFG